MSDRDEPWEYQDPEDEEPRPRDNQVDLAKGELQEFFENRWTDVFYERQLEVIFEGTYFHWITQHALHELTDQGSIASDLMDLPSVGTIRFYRHKHHRYWKRQARQIVSLVSEFSLPTFTRALGQQAETLFDAALPTAGFLPTARNTRSYKAKTWTRTAHDLDRIFERDSVAYGAEIKNTLSYIPQTELYVKPEMCAYLGLRPLFIVRSAPKSYIELVRQRGGFTLMFKHQLYPFGSADFAARVRERLEIPVDVPTRIADGTTQRFLSWHLHHLPR